MHPTTRRGPGGDRAASGTYKGRYFGVVLLGQTVSLSNHPTLRQFLLKMRSCLRIQEVYMGVKDFDLSDVSQPSVPTGILKTLGGKLASNIITKVLMAIPER